MKLANEGWGNVNQNFVDDRVDSMPQRLQDRIEMEENLGEITFHNTKLQHQ
jgi:hypothetical protein